jgi:hypothetical protein
MSKIDGAKKGSLSLHLSSLGKVKLFLKPQEDREAHSFE